jgi:hypothetical protein
MTSPTGPKPKRAAPVAKSDDVIERILATVSDGTPLAEVLREDWAPHPSTFYDWLNDDPELDRRFARVREIGHDVIAANIRNIARGEKGSSKDVKRDRLIVDADLKLLEKWDRRYRPAQVLAGDPEAPLVFEHHVGMGGHEQLLADILARAAARRAYHLSNGFALDLANVAAGRLAEVRGAVQVIEGVIVDADGEQALAALLPPPEPGRSADASDLA